MIPEGMSLEDLTSPTKNHQTRIRLSQKYRPGDLVNFLRRWLPSNRDDKVACVVTFLRSLSDVDECMFSSTADLDAIDEACKAVVASDHLDHVGESRIVACLKQLKTKLETLPIQPVVSVPISKPMPKEVRLEFRWRISGKCDARALCYYRWR